MLTLTTPDFLSALEFIAPFVDKGSTIPICRTVRLEPVDDVLWLTATDLECVGRQAIPIQGGDGPPEMKLLERSIEADGYTQPIVTMPSEQGREVIDGFHRNRVGKESAVVRDRVFGYLPVVTINESRTDRGDRIAATIRHNRARGKHRIEGMSDIVVELKRRNWTDEKIGRELGMEPDEVLRLCQITGLAEMFMDQEFSHSWDIDTADESEVVSDDLLAEGGE